MSVQKSRYAITNAQEYSNFYLATGRFYSMDIDNSIYSKYSQS